VKKLTSQYKKQTRGFTLIEMMVVISLMVMLMLTAASLFFTTLIGTSKTNVTTQVKEEGDFAISQIEFLLRNAIELVPNSSGQTCQSGMESIAFKSYDNGITELLKEEDPSDNNSEKIASNSGIYLTSSRVELINGPSFNCTQANDGSAPHITTSFTIRKGTPGIDQARDIVEETFTSGVSLRGAY
jgi:prepilin-type N-terminal cleavage/methylation domain-containing protein